MTDDAYINLADDDSSLIAFTVSTVYNESSFFLTLAYGYTNIAVTSASLPLSIQFSPVKKT